MNSIEKALNIAFSSIFRETNAFSKKGIIYAVNKTAKAETMHTNQIIFLFVFISLPIVPPHSQDKNIPLLTPSSPSGDTATPPPNAWT